LYQEGNSGPPVGAESWRVSDHPSRGPSQLSIQLLIGSEPGCMSLFHSELPFNGKAWLGVLLGGLFFLLSPSNLFGLTGDLTNDPVKVIEKYLSLDQRGARLEAGTSEVLKPYIAWTEEPAWGQVVVISDYTVAQDTTQWEIFSYLEAVIPVTFQILGFMQWETATFLADPRTEELSIRIRAVENRWRIVDPLFPPHVGRKRLINFVRQALLNETNEVRIETLQRLKESLERAG